MMRRLAFSIALALATLAGPAFAQEPTSTTQAAQAYDAGTRAFDRGDFVEAARAFERADSMAAHPRARYNAALSWDRAGDVPRAADAYTAALEGKGLDPERTDAAQRRFRELTKQLGAIDVRRPAGGKVTVAHIANAAIPVRVHVKPGTHRVELVSADGTRETRDIDVRVGERVVLEIAITSVPLVTAPAPSAPTPAGEHPSQSTSSDADHAEGSSRKTWGFVALGGAAAFAAGAVVFGFRTASAIDDFDTSGDRDTGARDRAVRYRAFTWVAGGASLACATVGIVLLAGGGKEKSAKRFELRTRGTGIVADWRF